MAGLRPAALVSRWDGCVPPEEPPGGQEPCCRAGAQGSRRLESGSHATLLCDPEQVTAALKPPFPHSPLGDESSSSKAEGSPQAPPDHTQGSTEERARADAHGALTLYMWANSISKGVSRERGGGFTVTEMTLEFRTVVFLGSHGRVRGSGSPFPECPPMPVPLPPRLPQAAPPGARAHL